VIRKLALFALSVVVQEQLNGSNMGQTPAQCRGDDQNYGDHTEISGLLSSR
jgi:hypothetical protein